MLLPWETYKVYGLCKKDGEIRYVGRTCTDISLRAHQHIYKRHKLRDKKFAKWLTGDLFYVILDTSRDFDRSVRMEAFWIAHYSRIGARLFNKAGVRKPLSIEHGWLDVYSEDGFIDHLNQAA